MKAGILSNISVKHVDGDHFSMFGRRLMTAVDFQLSLNFMLVTI